MVKKLILCHYHYSCSNSHIALHMSNISITQRIIILWLSQTIANINNFAHSIAGVAGVENAPQRVSVTTTPSISIMKHVLTNLIESHRYLSNDLCMLPSAMLEAVDQIYTSDNHLQYSEYCFLSWLSQRYHTLYCALVSSPEHIYMRQPISV